MTNKIMFIFVFNALLLVAVDSSFTAAKQWAVNQAHSQQINAVAFYNDGTKFVTGSKDKTIKVWSMTDFSQLYSQTFSDQVIYVALHPVDNRIFILIFDGTIKVLNPTTYATVRTDTYPNSGAGNSLNFFDNNSKYIVSGYDGANPVYHIYNAATYAAIAGGATTNHASGSQIFYTSVSRDSQYIVSISKQITPPILTEIHSLTTNTLVTTFADNFALLKFVIFNPYINQFYVASNDKTIKFYSVNPQTNKYDVSYSFSTKPYGSPNCMNANINGQLLISADKNLVFLNLTTDIPKTILSAQDQNDVFVCDISKNGKYVASGMRNGEVTIWKLQADIAQPQKQDHKLLIILVCTLGGALIIVGITLACYFCVCRKKTVMHNEQQSYPQLKNNDIAKQEIHGKTHIVIHH